ncbi:Chemotaxis protein CheV [Vibrio chagasii]|nr:Chemotaxis protein CheV [Vibrio chagasii]
MSIINKIDEKTDYVGKNRFEVLLFSLGSKQRFGINVFKVREVLELMPLNAMPGSPEVVKGVANIRGESLPVIDLAASIGLAHEGNYSKPLLIVTEYNDNAQAFLVSSVDRILNINWEDISEPPVQVGGTSYVTSITKVEDEIVGILDVERVMAEIIPSDDKPLPKDMVDIAKGKALGKKVLFCDDSVVARKQVEGALKELGYEFESFKNGQETYEHILAIQESGRDITDVYSLLVSDIEMPKMDGYTLTSNLKNHKELCKLPVILHTSMSGVFNESMVKRVGADRFLAKFKPEILASAIIELSI